MKISIGSWFEFIFIEKESDFNHWSLDELFLLLTFFFLLFLFNDGDVSIRWNLHKKKKNIQQWVKNKNISVNKQKEENKKSSFQIRTDSKSATNSRLHLLANRPINKQKIINK